MADLNITPEQIQAATAFFNAVSAQHPMIGTILGVIASFGALAGVVHTITTWINSARTKKNTAANEATAKMLIEFNAVILAAKDGALKEINEKAQKYSDTMQKSTQDLSTQAMEIKKAIANLSLSTKEKLSMIPKIQDAIEALTKKSLEQEFKVAQQDEKLDKFIAGMERIRRKNG